MSAGCRCGRISSATAITLSRCWLIMRSSSASISAKSCSRSSMVFSVRQVLVLGNGMIIAHVWPREYCFSFESSRTIYYDTPIDEIRYWLQCTGGDSMVQPVVNYTPLTPLSFLVRSAYVFPEKTAVV